MIRKRHAMASSFGKNTQIFASFHFPAMVLITFNDTQLSIVTFNAVLDAVLQMAPRRLAYVSPPYSISGPSGSHMGAGRIL